MSSETNEHINEKAWSPHFEQSWKLHCKGRNEGLESKERDGMCSKWYKGIKRSVEPEEHPAGTSCY